MRRSRWQACSFYKKVRVIVVLIQPLANSLPSYAAYAPLLLQRKANKIQQQLTGDSEKGEAPREVRTVYSKQEGRTYVTSVVLYSPTKTNRSRSSFSISSLQTSSVRLNLLDGANSSRNPSPARLRSFGGSPSRRSSEYTWRLSMACSIVSFLFPLLFFFFFCSITMIDRPLSRTQST